MSQRVRDQNKAIVVWRGLIDRPYRWQAEALQRAEGAGAVGVDKLVPHPVFAAWRPTGGFANDGARMFLA